VQEELAKSENNFRQVFHFSPDPITINRLDDGMYVMINPAFSNITGYAEADIIGKTDVELNIWDSLQSRENFITGLKSDREIISLESGFRTKDGTILYGLISAAVIKLNGVPHCLSICRNITDRKLAEEQLRESLNQVRRAVGTTVQVLVATVEAKDPYTAGHQRRTTDLARAIATEMGLPFEKIEGIRLAGIIHDIGKINVPSEILSKPYKLSSDEYSLIKEHVRFGYDILQCVESPWPLAEIVYQHHERIDSSGYPRKLKGYEILIEAKILAIADVVEAMSSHRPYRAALGIPAALQEIENNKGKCYDYDFANACIRLFREKNYNFKSTS
jgi:PAS domain S-box-containing protein